MTMVAESSPKYDVGDPDRLRWDDYVEHGRALVESHDSAAWELGVLAGEVETTYGGRDLQKFADAIGLSADTIDDYRRIARRFPGGSRKLALGVLHALARIEDADEREEWLERAERERWSVSRARREVAEQFAPLKTPPILKEEGTKQNVGMKASPDRAVAMFENIAAGFEALTAESEYVEKDDAARGMTSERRRAAERAVQRAQEFVDYWSDVLMREVAPTDEWGA